MTISDESERKVQLDLTEGTWTCGPDKGELDASGLSSILIEGRNAQAPSPAMLQQEESLLSSLHQMHAGEFLRPRHHTYHVDIPIRAFYQHFTIGRNCGLYAVFMWLLVWPVYLALSRQPSTSRWLAPTRVFFLTGCFVITLDLLFAGIHGLFSPGSISEAMELLIGLLNMPAWIVLGERSALTWLGMAFGAVSWSVLLSMAAVFMSPAQRHASTPGAPANDQSPLE
jgi:hypothetical protein